MAGKSLNEQLSRYLVIHSEVGNQARSAPRLPTSSNGPTYVPGSVRPATLIGILIVVALTSLAVPASAQVASEGRVTLDFTESEVSLGPDQETVVPIQVRAELECFPLHDPPVRGVLISGQRGVAFSGPDGFHYTTEVEPKELPFQQAGPNRYVVDQLVFVVVRTEVPVRESINSTVGYFTSWTSEGETCAPLGWTLPQAEPASFTLRLVPPEVITESSGASALSAITAVLAGSWILAAQRHAASARDNQSLQPTARSARAG